MAPLGWKLVPLLPSEKQIAAALRKWFGEHGPFFTTLGDVQRGYMRDAYTAMLEASPSPTDETGTTADHADCPHNPPFRYCEHRPDHVAECPIGLPACKTLAGAQERRRKRRRS